jgi:hypothetical protein
MVQHSQQSACKYPRYKGKAFLDEGLENRGNRDSGVPRYLDKGYLKGGQNLPLNQLANSRTIGMSLRKVTR